MHYKYDFSDILTASITRAESTSETSVNFYETTLHSITEDLHEILLLWDAVMALLPFTYDHDKFYSSKTYLVTFPS
jgi:hypothetical protein